MTTRPDASRAPRSASILKARLIEAHRHEFEAGLAWAADPMVEAAAARITGARRRFVLGAATSFTYASLLAAKLSNSLAQVTLDGTVVGKPLDVLSDIRTDLAFLSWWSGQACVAGAATRSTPRCRSPRPAVRSS